MTKHEIALLRAKHDLAVKKGKRKFTFRDEVLLTSYAGQLLEFLESKERSA